MTTEEAKVLALANQKEFIQWVTDWHDRCHIDVCLIKDALWMYNCNKSSIEQLFEVVAEEDGDWESFEQYIKSDTYANNH